MAQMFGKVPAPTCYEMIPAEVADSQAGQSHSELSFMAYNIWYTNDFMTLLCLFLVSQRTPGSTEQLAYFVTL